MKPSFSQKRSASESGRGDVLAGSAAMGEVVSIETP
jgi:hypothetical protein